MDDGSVLEGSADMTNVRQTFEMRDYVRTELTLTLFEVTVSPAVGTLPGEEKPKKPKKIKAEDLVRVIRFRRKNR
jgi:hypothetical protein